DTRYLALVSLYRSADHPALHSFPTRRSSDLTSCGRSCTAWPCSPSTATWITRAPTPARSRATPSSACARGSASVVIPSSEPTVRSEEHTSELQSRENLVCRLLLEKKKKKRKT